MEFVNSHGAFKSLHVDFADYHPAKFERLEDLSAGRATRKVMYTKPHGYNELEYRVYNTELRMEFYLWLVRKFCHRGGALLSIFGGGKITCTTVVSNELARLDLIWLVLSTVDVNFMRVLWIFVMAISVGRA